MPTSALLERSTPLAEIDGCVSSMRSGGSGIVLVSGEAGVGKTTLLATALRRLDPGLLVLRGACDDLVAANPLGALREACRGLAVADVIASGRLEDVLSALSLQFAQRPPSVLVIEDLHWADDATVDVLAYLARRIDQLNVLLVASYRDDEVTAGHPAQRFLATASGSRTVRIRLAPLEVGSVAQLAVGSGWDARLLHDITGGNPFYLTETLAAPPDAPVPSSVSDAVLARLSRLPPRTRDAVERISVWPGLLDFPLAEDLLGADLDSLAGAEELGVLTVSPDGVSFRHELARLATEASLSGFRRRRLQADVTAALRRRAVGARGAADLSRLVHHAMLCGDADTVAEFAPQAGEVSARVGAHRQALTFFAAALEHADRLAPPVLARVLDGYAWELYNAHRFGEAVVHGTRAAELWSAQDDNAAEASALGRLSRHLFMNAQPDDARVRAIRAVELSAQEPSVHAAAEIALGALLALDVSGSGAPEILTRGEQGATRAGRTDLVALSQNYRSLAEPELTADERIALLRSSITAAHRAGAHEFEARGYTNLTEILYRYGQHAELADNLDGWLRFTRDHGFWSHSFNLELHAALLQVRTGRGGTAESVIADLIGRYPNPGMLALYTVPAYGRLLARRGDPAAQELLRRAWAQALRQRMLIGLGYAGAALMEWAWLNSDRVTAQAVLKAWSVFAERPTAAPLWAEIRRYGQHAGLEVPSTAGCGSADPWDLGLAGDWSAAAARWMSIGDSFEAGRELAGSGQIEPTQRALAIFSDLGAGAAARFARTRLSALGARAVRGGPSARTRRNPHGLTDRQVDIALLVADGLTNAEIADRLVLSVRTVDAHVSAILSKLSVRRRREVARIAATWRHPAQNPD